MKKKHILKNEKGFTLIEIIAVIIIMGILAAVAVPRFFSMQEDAKIAALNGGLSEAAARFNHAFAKFILVEKKAPADIATDLASTDYLGTDPTVGGTGIGDFTVTWNKTGADGVTIEIIDVTDSIMTDATLAAMDIAYRQKVITGITWGS
jgi:MSHA pilin protein MshA